MSADPRSRWLTSPKFPIPPGSSRPPTISGWFSELADSARSQGSTFGEYPATVLGRRVDDREGSRYPVSGIRLRTRAAHVPRITMLGDLNVGHQLILLREVLEHPTASTYLAEADGVGPLGPRAGKTRLAVALGYRAIAGGYAVQFDPALGWPAELQTAHAEKHPEPELREPRRCKPLRIDEAGGTRPTSVPRYCSADTRLTATSDV